MNQHTARIFAVGVTCFLLAGAASAQDSAVNGRHLISQNDPTINSSADISKPYTLKAGHAFNITALSPAANEKMGTDYAIQLGAFAIKNNALRMQRRLIHDGYRAEIYEDYLDGKNLLYLVWVGSYESREQAVGQMTTFKSAYQIDGILMIRSGVKQK